MFQIRRASLPLFVPLLPALAVIAAIAVIALFAGCQGLKRNRSGQLRLELHSIPETIPLGETRRFLAEAVLINAGDRKAVLTWPSQQKSEAELFDPLGQLLHRWSDDQSFDSPPAHMTLNPGERAFFEMVMPTRGMVAGERHQLVARLVGSPPLQAKIELTPIE